MNFASSNQKKNGLMIEKCHKIQFQDRILNVKMMLSPLDIQIISIRYCVARVHLYINGCRQFKDNRIISVPSRTV